MVFHDISDIKENSKKNKRLTDASAAHIMDRFFSFLIDYLVISPFVLFFLYLTFQDGFTIWKSDPRAPENESFIFILGLGFVFYFSLIQAVFINLWRATPGQFFLKINLQFEESESLLFLRAFFRQFCFWLSFAMLGIPFLAVLTNRRRLTFYDRMAGTAVMTRKKQEDFFDFEIEFKYWQSLMATLVLFVSFLASAYLWKNYEKVVSRVASFAQLQDKKFFCAELLGVNVNERMQVAIGLNLANQLSDNCLDREADFVLWKQKEADISLAYYAKSLTTEDSEKEQSYLQQACLGEDTGDYESLTLGCRIAYSFSQKNLEKLYENLGEGVFLTDALKYELSLILKKHADVDANLAKLAQYNSLKSIKKYQLTEMLWRSENSRGRSPASVDSVDAEDRHDQMLKLIEGL